MDSVFKSFRFPMGISARTSPCSILRFNLLLRSMSELHTVPSLVGIFVTYSFTELLRSSTLRVTSVLSS